MTTRFGIWADVILINKTGNYTVCDGLLKAWGKKYPNLEIVLYFSASVDKEKVADVQKAYPGVHCNRLKYERKRLMLSWITFGGLSLSDMGVKCDCYFSSCSHALGNNDRPIICLHHDLSYHVVAKGADIKTRLINRLAINRMLRIAKVATISSYSREAFAKWAKIDPKRIILAPDGIDDEWFNLRSKQKVENAVDKYKINRPYFIFVGAMVIRKNIPFLMRAFKQAFPNGGPQLVMVGPNTTSIRSDGSWVCDEVYKVIKSLQLEDSVKTLGIVPQEDLIRLVSGAQALVFPSLYEGFGLPAAEAMAVGTPVICSNTSSLPEIVGDCGILLDPMNIKEWANAMKRVLNNREDYQTIIDRARVKSQSYSFDTMAKILANVYATEFGINFH